MAPADADLPLSRYRPRARLTLPEPHVPAARFPAVDAHSHPGRWLSAWVGRPGEWMVADVDPWLERMADFNVHGFVNLDGRWGDELRANLERFDERHPDRVATFCHVDWSLLQGGSAAEALAANLADSVAAGAPGVEVWKHLALHVRDHADELALPDHERLAAVWPPAGERRVPIWWPVAYPAAFFD